MGLFTSAGWKNLISTYEEKNTLKVTTKQMKNNLDNMKWFTEFKNCTIGLGRNEEKLTVECSKEW